MAFGEDYTTPMANPQRGRLLAKRYQLTLEGWAMGRIYRAKDVLLGGVPVSKISRLVVQIKKKTPRAGAL